MESKTIIIGGGSGLIGTALSKHLQSRGHNIRILSRNPQKVTEYDSYFWNPIENKIDKSVLSGAEIIINLAGANIAAERWTEERKRLIIQSRTSSNLIFKKFLERTNSIKKYIAASAQGFYGDHGDKVLDESAQPTSEGFLSNSTQEWEKAIKETVPDSMDSCIMRNGIVLSVHGGPVAELKTPAKFGIFPQFGNGKQYLSWIHIDDIVEIYTQCVENEEYTGIMNIAAPNPATYRAFAKAMKKAKNGFLPVIPIPAIALKLGLGQMANSLLESVRLEPGRLNTLGYNFRFTDINKAVKDVFERQK